MAIPFTGTGFAPNTTYTATVQEPGTAPQSEQVTTDANGDVSTLAPGFTAYPPTLGTYIVTMGGATGAFTLTEAYLASNDDG